MQNNHLEEQDVNLSQADNRTIKQLRDGNWSYHLAVDNNRESEEALIYDMHRPQFLVMHKAFMEQLEVPQTETADPKTEIELLIAYLKTTFPYVPQAQIIHDVSNLQRTWTQEIGATVRKAIHNPLSSTPSTEHLHPTCDYTTNLTYENGKLIVEVNYLNFKLLNSSTYNPVPLPGNASARWELDGGELKLQKITSNNPVLVSLISNATVPDQLIPMFNQPDFRSKTASYLVSKKEQIEKLWQINSSDNLDRLPDGVRKIYEKCLEAQTSHADVPKLAKEVSEIWEKKWNKRENQQHSFLGKAAENIDKYTQHRDTKSEIFYTSPSKTKKTN